MGRECEVEKNTNLLYILKMPTFNDIYDLYLDKADYAIKMSEIFLQKEWWLRNLSETWDVVEIYIRDLLREFLPKSKFRIVTWYITSHQNIENNDQLYQCDIIIADESVPSIAILWNWIEIVPVESVCGLLEIKRSLRNSSSKNKQPYKKAIEHINNIVNSTKIDKSKILNTLPGAIKCWWALQSWFRANPLIWIIALKSWYVKKNSIDKLLDDILQEIESTNSLIDFVWSLDWTSLMTQLWSDIIAQTSRASNNSRLKVASDNVRNKNMLDWIDTTSKSKIFARCIWFISIYLSKTTWFPTSEWFYNDYFFNQNVL